jgi:hypothetical protein
MTTSTAASGRSTKLPDTHGFDALRWAGPHDAAQGCDSWTVASALSLNAIARQMGLTAPALYRYFADRDAPLAELVIDAYDDLADALEAAVAEQPDTRSADRLRAFAAAYRAWAISQPHRYRLLFGAPIPPRLRWCMRLSWCPPQV